MAGGLKKAGVLGVGGLGGGQIKGLQGHPVRGGFVGEAGGFVLGTADKIAASRDEAEAEALGLQALLGSGRGANEEHESANYQDPGFAGPVSSFQLPRPGQLFGRFHEG